MLGRLDPLLPQARLRQAAYLLGLGQGAHELAVAHAMSPVPVATPVGAVA